MHGRLQVGAERGKIQFFCVWSVSSRKWLELTAQGLYVVQQGSLRVYWCYWGGHSLNNVPRESKMQHCARNSTAGTLP